MQQVSELIEVVFEAIPMIVLQVYNGLKTDQFNNQSDTYFFTLSSLITSVLMGFLAAIEVTNILYEEKLFPIFFNMQKFKKIA